MLKYFTEDRENLVAEELNACHLHSYERLKRNCVWTCCYPNYFLEESHADAHSLFLVLDPALLQHVCERVRRVDPP